MHAGTGKQVLLFLWRLCVQHAIFFQLCVQVKETEAAVEQKNLQQQDLVDRAVKAESEKVKMEQTLPPSQVALAILLAASKLYSPFFAPIDNRAL